jgi:hypothetical protein
MKPQETAGRDEPDERTRGVRSTAEPEDVDFVCVRGIAIVAVVRNQPVVGRTDVLFEPERKAPAADPIEHAGADTGDVVLVLLDAAVRQRSVQRQCEVLQHVGAVVLVVPRSVETDDESLFRAHRRPFLPDDRVFALADQA